MRKVHGSSSSRSKSSHHLGRPKHILSESLETALSLTNTYSAFTRYALAVLSSALAIVLKLGLRPLMGNEAPYLFVLPAVIVSAWFGGIGPAIVATLMTAMAINYFFLPPQYSFELNSIQAFAGIIIYLIEAVFIIFIVQRRNRASQQMKERASQQAIVAVTGQFGLEEQDIDVLMDRVVHAIDKTLKVDHCSIFELLPDGKSFRLTSGTGWKKGQVRNAFIQAGNDSYEGYTLQQNKPVIMSDISREKRFNKSEILEGHGVVSGVTVPITGHPQPFGVLSVYTSKKRIFSKEDINFIRAMANVLATTLERKVVQEELELIASLNTELTSSLNPHKSLSNLVHLLVPRFADFIEVYVIQNGDKPGFFEVAAREKSKATILTHITKKYPPPENPKRPMAKVLKSGKGILVGDASEDWRKSVAVDKTHLSLLNELSLVSFMVVPIKVRTQTIGVITFGSTPRGRIYTPRDFHLAQEIANRAAVAIDNGRLYKEAQDAIQARDEFLSIASHELKTPLTSLLLQLQSVLNSIKNDSLANFSIDRTMNSLENMIGQSKRINRLVNDLLNISLITTGRMKLEKEQVDLRQVVVDVVTRLRDQAEKNGSTITIHDGKSILGKWDKIRLEQVVTNLVANAIKYGDNKPISVNLEKNGKTALFTVSDQGIGIPKEKQNAIFDRFKRASNAKQSFKGLGVGLYLVQQIVQAHRGTIKVESKQGKGSIFVVELPLKS